MYYGEAHSAVDEKGRLAIPIHFRRIMDALDHTIWFITRGYDNSLFLFERVRWEKLLKEELPQATLEPRKMDFRRFLVGSSAKLKLDRQGRLIIPQYLREYAGIDREGVILGMEDHLQVWSETNWREYNQRQAAEYKKMAAELFGTHTFNAAEPKEEA